MKLRVEYVEWSVVVGLDETNNCTLTWTVFTCMCWTYNISIFSLYTGAVFVLDMAAYSVMEGAGSLSVRVQLSNRVIIATDIEVIVRTTAGTAMGK